MALLAAAIPILPGQRDRWDRFTDELRGSRNADFTASRARLGVRERVFLQETPGGDMVVVTLEGDDPLGAFARFGEGNDAFTNWFVEEVQAIHGMDLRNLPHDAAPRQVIDSQNA